MKQKEPMRVLIASGSEKGLDYLSTNLPTGDFQMVSAVTSGAEARRKLAEEQIDLVFLNCPLTDEFGTELAMNITESGYTETLILVKSELYDQVAYKVESCGVLVIPKPVPHGALHTGMFLAAACRQRLKMAEQKTVTIQKKMEDIRLINRAKFLLVEKLGMSEADAHRFVEKQAMDLRQTKREVAESLIRTYEN